MAARAAPTRCCPRLFWPLGCALVLLGCVSGASPSHGRRLVCWQAIMKCHGEPDCHYAYEQYVHACAPVLNGARKKCPSHCISSLVQLNLTANGPALEDCDCASDRLCRDTKRAIEPCLPRTRSTGCTDARRQCETDARCGGAMRDYLLHCGKLFSGVRCTDACRDVIANMRKIPKAELLDTCVCDGSERTICEFVKVSMKTLCFDARDEYTGSGFSHLEDDSEEGDVPEDPWDEDSAGAPSRPPHALTALALILAMLSHL
ncbi:growth arrest-specific protein 1-like [Scleropages formosus]|uniref:Growth arrest-specific 1a n=1 Tax=Scleropages formosus TaxID=113540 RepID=A0A8D0CK33_SCLFO|nr:growth arrest-specific protein 1-like [Scleropages formosus]